MHAHQRDSEITRLLQSRGFVSFKQLCDKLEASSATIQHNIERLESQGVLERVHGGARLKGGARANNVDRLAGTTFEQNKLRHAEAKAAIGRAAAKLCEPGEAIIIDGGTTTFQMCPYLEGLELQVLTNHFPHIVGELLAQPGHARVRARRGDLSRTEHHSQSLRRRRHEPLSRIKLFMGAAAIGARGLMQTEWF